MTKTCTTLPSVESYYIVITRFSNVMCHQKPLTSVMSCIRSVQSDAKVAYSVVGVKQQSNDNVFLLIPNNHLCCVLDDGCYRMFFHFLSSIAHLFQCSVRVNSLPFSSSQLCDKHEWLYGATRHDLSSRNKDNRQHKKEYFLHVHLVF